jgi:Ner family transcriptional regulator
MSARKRDRDWHPEDVKAALRKRGIVLTHLAVEHDLHPNTVSTVLRRPAARVQAIIAGCLGVDPQTIWPSRYNADGSPRRRNQRRPDCPPAQRQKREAA